MGPVTAIKLFYTRYFDVYGRSRRFEYAWMLLAHAALVILLPGLAMMFGVTGNFDSAENLNSLGKGILALCALISIGSIIPWITLNIRRFHDMNYTGWMVALFVGLWLIPPIGALGSIIQFFWVLFGGGTPGTNKYGHDPRFSPSNVFN